MAARDIGVRGQMDHGAKVCAREQGVQRALVGHVHFLEREAIAPLMVRHMLAPPQQQVVRDRDAVPPLQEAVNEMTADEAKSTSDENVHVAPPRHCPADFRSRCPAMNCAMTCMIIWCTSSTTP